MCNVFDGCKYIFDACSFMELEENHSLGIDFLPTLWDKIADKIEKGEIVTVSEVMYELQGDKPSDRKSINAYDWVKSKNCSVIPLTKEIQEKAKEVLRKEPKLLELKQGKSSADVFLVATAWLLDKTIVTQERSFAENKIPRICERLGVKVLDIKSMCKREGIAI